MRSTFVALAITLAVVNSSAASLGQLDTRSSKLQCRKQALGNLKFVDAASLTSDDSSGSGVLGSLTGSGSSADAGTVAGFQASWDISKLRSSSANGKRDSSKARKASSKEHSLHHHHVEAKKKEKHLHHQLSESTKNKSTKPQKAVKAVKADSREGQIAPGALAAAPPAANGSGDGAAKGGKLHSTKAPSSRTKSTHLHKATKTAKSKTKSHNKATGSATKSKDAAATPVSSATSLLVLLAPIATDDAKSTTASAVQPDTTPLFNFYSCNSPMNNVYGTLNGDGQQLVGQIRNGVECLARKDIKGVTYVVQQACFMRDNDKLERQLWILDYSKGGSDPTLRAWSTSNNGEGGYLLPGDSTSPAVGIATAQGQWAAVLGS